MKRKLTSQSLQDAFARRDEHRPQESDWFIDVTLRLKLAEIEGVTVPFPLAVGPLEAIVSIYRGSFDRPAEWSMITTPENVLDVLDVLAEFELEGWSTPLDGGYYGEHLRALVMFRIVEGWVGEIL